MKVFKLALSAIVMLATLNGCSEAPSDTLGTPSLDPEAGRMRWHFKQGQILDQYGDIQNTQWHCVQRSAIKGSFHTSYFVHKFHSYIPGMLHSVAVFDTVPAAETRIILNRSWNSSLTGSSRGAETDRYGFYPDDDVYVFIRRLSDKVLMQEWAVLPKTTPFGRIVRGVSTIVPELTGSPRQMMETAFSRPTMLAFMYASCTNAELIKDE